MISKFTDWRLWYVRKRGKKLFVILRYAGRGGGNRLVFGTWREKNLSFPRRREPPNRLACLIVRNAITRLTDVRNVKPTTENTWFRRPTPLGSRLNQRKTKNLPVARRWPARSDVAIIGHSGAVHRGPSVQEASGFLGQFSLF